MEWTPTHGNPPSEGKRLHDCLYGEEDEDFAASSLTKTGYGSWSLQFRFWLRQKHHERQQDTANMLDTTDTMILQNILSQLTSLPDFEPNDHKDLLAPVEEETAELFIRYWKEHQRFFVLKDLRAIWNRCCPVHYNLIHSIIEHVDRITGNAGVALPNWMGNKSLQDESAKTYPDNSLANRKQTLVTKVLEEYFDEYFSQSNEESISYDTEGKSDAHFSTWISQQLPQDDCRLDSLCRQLGEQGSRGKLSLQLQHSLTIHGCSPDSLPLGFSRPCNTRDPDGSKGEAILRELVRIIPDTVDSQEAFNSQERDELPSWTAATGKEFSIQQTIEMFLTRSDRCPSLGLLVDWLWRGAQAIADGTVDKPSGIRDDLLESIRVFAQWIPFGSFARRYVAFVNEQLSSLTRLNVQGSQIFPEIILAWLGDDCDWWSFWWHWLDKDDQLVKRVLAVYHQCAGFELDSDELPRIRASCSILTGLLKSLDPVASCAPKDFKPRLLEAFSLFRDIDFLQSRTTAEDDPIRGFCSLVGGISTNQVMSSLSLKTFVESAIEFSSNSSASEAQGWCQKVVDDCCRWNGEEIGQTWIESLLGHFQDTKVIDISSESLLTRQLGTLIRSVWTSYASDVSSLVEMLVDNARSFPLDAIDFLLEHSPPELLFVHAQPASIHNILKEALGCFHSKSWFIVLLGLALKLEAQYVARASHYPDSRQNCLVVARGFLLNKIRRNENSQLEAAVSASGYIRKRLFNTKVALKWWEDVCRDLLDRPEYKARDDHNEDMSPSSDPTLVENPSLQESRSELEDMTASEQELSFRPAKRPRTSSRSLDSIVSTGKDSTRPENDARQGNDGAWRSTGESNDNDPLDCGDAHEEIHMNSDEDYDESKDDILFLDL